MFAITVEGVDRVKSEQHPKTINKLLTDQRRAPNVDGDEKRFAASAAGNPESVGWGGREWAESKQAARLLRISLPPPSGLSRSRATHNR